jgi:hypothetical protein
LNLGLMITGGGPRIGLNSFEQRIHYTGRSTWHVWRLALMRGQGVNVSVIQSRQQAFRWQAHSGAAGLCWKPLQDHIPPRAK